MSSVKVAVRVRPFNSREIERGSRCIIEMKSSQTIITNPAQLPKDGAPPDPSAQKVFNYDFSYQSFDTAIPDFANQEKVFNDLGLEVLKNAWEGKLFYLKI
jgi:kinesin family protein 1